MSAIDVNSVTVSFVMSGECRAWKARFIVLSAFSLLAPYTNMTLSMGVLSIFDGAPPARLARLDVHSVDMMSVTEHVSVAGAAGELGGRETEEEELEDAAEEEEEEEDEEEEEEDEEEEALAALDPPLFAAVRPPRFSRPIAELATTLSWSQPSSSRRARPRAPKIAAFAAATVEAGDTGLFFAPLGRPIFDPGCDVPLSPTRFIPRFGTGAADPAFAGFAFFAFFAFAGRATVRREW